MTVYLAATAALIGGAVVLNRLSVRLLSPVRRLPDRPMEEVGLEHERIEVPSHGRRLGAWLFHGVPEARRAPLVVVAHGWGASHGTTFLIAEPLVKRGFDVLLFDIRGHGRNEVEPYVTIRDFRDDVSAVLRAARERFPARPVVLVGHSMGGAGGILAAAEGAPMDGLVLIAAPADVVEVTSDFLTEHGMPGWLMTLVLRPFWWTKLGGSLLPLTPRRRIAEVRQPMLMLQPELDQRVHRGHAERLAGAAGLEVHLIEEHEHTDVLGAPRTLELVEGFLDRF